ncbi:M28 family peptidase [Bacteroidia bacterium]|nr:M28 family peptidase [Bacteroidia bacterium]MDB9882067.1 M28 family peptidase [Bacteroidia bacterium]
MKLNKTLLAFTFLLLAFYSCSDSKKSTDGDKPTTETKRPFTVKFNADSAYQYIQEQVDFGPRVPGTDAHAKTAIYLQNKLVQFCDTAFMQLGSATSYKVKYVEIKNVIGSINTDKTKRILLCAHWDTRPQADQDLENPTTPADGANDGASGVGVLIEVARQLQAQRPDAGVDIIFFDAEDMGDSRGEATTWCLGSQYWAKTPHKQNYVARFGILLDMVGPKDAVFAIEGNSWQYAQPYIKKVWQTAAKLGHSKYFVNQHGGQITDDHVFVNKIRGIPTLDIIHYDVSNGSGFGEFWHRHSDNMESIDKNTLKAVGETVFKVVVDL